MAFLVVGEAIVDLIGAPRSWRFSAVAGGSPLNVAVALAALGRPVRFAGEVGDDFFGELLLSHLCGHGVGTAEVTTRDATSLAFARLGADGSASYDFRFGWRFDAPVSLDGVSCLHTGSLAALVEPGAGHVRALMRAAAEAGVPVSYDPNIRPSLLGDHATAVERVEECVRLARLVKVSREDLAWLYPGEPDLGAARRWSGLPGERLVVVTRGAEGAVAVLGDRLVTCPAPAVEVADTVGAGDTFTAAYLAALEGTRLDGTPPEGTLLEGTLLEGTLLDGTRAARTGGAAALSAAADDPERVAGALRYACAAAAAVCTRTGAVPPTPGEIDALLSPASPPGNGRDRFTTTRG